MHGVSAPVAPERAAPAGRNGDRGVATRLLPLVEITLHVDQIACGQRQLVEILDGRTRLIDSDLALGSPRNPWHLIEHLGNESRLVDEIEQVRDRLLAFVMHDQIDGWARQVRHGVHGRIGTAKHDGRSTLCCRRGEAQGGRSGSHQGREPDDVPRSFPQEGEKGCF